jgi:hypothetical protein
MPAADNIPTKVPAIRPDELRSPKNDGGTRALLQTGFWITFGAALALIATQTLFGGIGIDGPHTNAGWLSFMFALMGAPFGLLLLVLGGARWLRNRPRHPR